MLNEELCKSPSTFLADFFFVFNLACPLTTPTSSLQILIDSSIFQLSDFNRVQAGLIIPFQYLFLIRTIIGN